MLEEFDLVLFTHLTLVPISSSRRFLVWKFVSGTVQIYDQPRFFVRSIRFVFFYVVTYLYDQITIL